MTLLSESLSQKFLRRFTLSLLFMSAYGCGVIREREDNSPELASIISKPLPPEKNEELLTEVGENWLFGQGLGSTALTAGSIFVFPPYALYVVGNGILTISGYEPLYITDALPQSEKEGFNDIYDSVTGAPGRFTAAVAGKEYRTEEAAKQRLHSLLSEEADQAQ
ncbi:MAG: hypothetical protein J5J00_12635 [Deltaproteobacteria bacterium]|nr:hypothetical protein [Deltaproteobacteria bacterium]